MVHIFNTDVHLAIIILVGALIFIGLMIFFTELIFSNNSYYSRIYLKNEWKLYNKYLKLHENQFIVDRVYYPYKGGYHYSFRVIDEPNITIEIWYNKNGEEGISSSIHQDLKCLASSFIKEKSKALAERLMSIAESRSMYDPKFDILY